MYEPTLVKSPKNVTNARSPLSTSTVYKITLSRTTLAKKGTSVTFVVKTSSSSSASGCISRSTKAPRKSGVIHAEKNLSTITASNRTVSKCMVQTRSFATSGNFAINL